MKTASWEKTKNIFEQAMVVAPDERGRFLDAICADDEIVRREVEELLSSFDEAESFMETPAVAKVAELIEAETKTLESGQRFGRYEIIEPIGAGGMGEVYLARDNKLDRRVAIKILNESFNKHESNLNRFIQEAKSASGLNHPNILTIHEIGEAETAHYIVSEYIEGKTLREILEEKNLQLPEILDIVFQITNALTAAHAVGIVHRDIKPENIMIRPDGLVKILDFGLAKLIARQPIGFEENTLKQNETAKGVILGTVNYMSPEQAKGERVDERTDIFSFGVLIYEMIAGRKPFAGETVSETFANLINQEPQPLARYAANVPDDLQRIVSKTLRKNKDARYQTMKGLLGDLKELKENLSFAEKLERSQPPNENATAVLQASTGGANLWTEETTGSLSQKIGRKPFAVILPLVLLAAAIGFGVWYLQNRGVKQIESIAVLPFENKGSDADTDYLSDGLAESLIYRLSLFSNLKVSPTSSVFRYKGKETDPQVIAKELGVDSVLTGRIVKRGDSLTISVNLVDTRNGTSLWGEQYERKMSELLTTQREIASEITNKLQLKLSGEGEQKLTKKYTENNEAYQFYLRGRYEWNKFSFDGLTKSIPLFERAIQIDPTFALAYSGMADSYINLGVDYISAHDTMPKARVAAMQALALDDSLAEAHTSLGSYKMFYEWDTAGAEEEYRKAINLDPRYANARHFYSHCLQFSERETEAIREMKTAVELEPLSLVNNAELGWVYYLANQHEAAIEQLHKTIEIEPSFPYSNFILGLVYAEKGNYTEALAAFRESQKLSPDWLELQAELAYTYALAGDRREAEALLAKLLDSAADTYVNPVHIAAVYTALADNDHAIAWLERGYREKSSWMKWIAIEPQLERLRTDPRFQDIVRRVDK